MGSVAELADARDLGSRWETSARSIRVRAIQETQSVWFFVVNHCDPIAFSFRFDVPIQVDYTRSMITMLQGKYLTVTQAADAANCTVSYVRQLLRANKIQGEKAGERAWMVPVSEVPKIKKTKSEKTSKPS